MKIFKMTKLIIFFGLFTSSFAWSQNTNRVPNFQQVNEQVFRSGRPENNELMQMQKNYGIRAVINIEDNQSAVKQEKKIADSLGVEFISVPVATKARPSDQQVNQILAALRDTKNFPVLIHCMHGEDRTGMVMGIYRVEVQGWPPEKAYQEMLELGFHPKYKDLDQYFRDRTGFRGN